MSESTPQVYVKGSSTRLVRTARDRVAAEFAGYKPVQKSAEEADRSELQAVAKSLGIKANQSNEDLRSAIENFESEGGPAVDPSDQSETLGEAPETDDTESGTPADRALI